MEGPSEDGKLVLRKRKVVPRVRGEKQKIFFLMEMLHADLSVLRLSSSSLGAPEARTAGLSSLAEFYAQTRCSEKRVRRRT